MNIYKVYNNKIQQIRYECVNFSSKIHFCNNFIFSHITVPDFIQNSPRRPYRRGKQCTRFSFENIGPGSGGTPEAAAFIQRRERLPGGPPLRSVGEGAQDGAGRVC